MAATSASTSCVSRTGSAALEPDHVILIKADVFDAAFTHLQGEGLPVVDQRISFPGSGRQREFEASFATALEKIAWVMLRRR